MRCTGHCCRSFHLSSVPRGTADEQRAWARQHGQDGEQIADMVVPIGEDATGPLYTCRHLDEAGNCSIYNTRPRMCRTFPDGAACPFKGCTLGGS